MVAADARTSIIIALSLGNAHDAQCVRQLLLELGLMPEGFPLFKGKADESDETLALAMEQRWIGGFAQVQPAQSVGLQRETA